MPGKRIKLNKRKIELKKTSMEYIGYLLTADGVRVDPSKVKAILQMTQPYKVYDVTQDVQGV